MGTDASRVQMVSGSSGRAQCWVESLILALGSPRRFGLFQRSFHFRFPLWFMALLNNASWPALAGA